MALIRGISTALIRGIRGVFLKQNREEFVELSSTLEGSGLLD
jgi:hypothetical protein